jgi:hypothetical protein
MTLEGVTHSIVLLPLSLLRGAADHPKALADLALLPVFIRLLEEFLDGFLYVVGGLFGQVQDFKELAAFAGERAPSTNFCAKLTAKLNPYDHFRTARCLEGLLRDDAAAGMGHSDPSERS